MNYMITYQKASGEVFYRTKKVLSDLKIGDTTSMGWKVLDIHEKYNGNYIHPYEVRRYIRNKLYKEPIRKRLVKYVIKQLNKLA